MAKIFRSRGSKSLVRVIGRRASQILCAQTNFQHDCRCRYSNFRIRVRIHSRKLSPKFSSLATLTHATTGTKASSFRISFHGFPRKLYGLPGLPTVKFDLQTRSHKKSSPGEVHIWKRVLGIICQEAFFNATDFKNRGDFYPRDSIIANVVFVFFNLAVSVVRLAVHLDEGSSENS